MTDKPGIEPGHEPEQRLPATRPPAVPAPVERFTASPSVHSTDFPPERAAQIVRQSSNARWVGFLAVVIVILFVALYWFYELGAPLGLTTARQASEVNNQQVTLVEQGYNVFQANCARCHGAQGQGGIGPVLNSQDKLFQHLNENYLRNVLTVGGRYVCGDANSVMPVWSNLGNPPGPLNYRQIDEVVAFLRATSNNTYTIRDPELGTPMKDPVTGKVETFTGWRDPTYQPAPDATPYPACWKDSFTNASASPAASGSAGTSASPAASGSVAPSAAAGGTTVSIKAQGIAFTTPDVTAPAGAAFTLSFDNEDAGTPHNVDIKDASGAEAFKTDIFPGVATKTYQVPALAAGAYTFVCDVHANMTGTLTVK
jgi:plastocyanin/mono/diheme cytochrome c family protein